VAPHSEAASRRISILLALAVAPMLAADIIEQLSGRDFNHVSLTAGSVALVALVGIRLSVVVRQELQIRADHAAQTERIQVMQGVTRLMERDRAATAAEIHDGPVQHLPSLALHLARADLRLAQGDLVGGRAIAEQVREGLEEEVADLRRVMAGLHPPRLLQMGLEVAVRDLGGALAERAGCTVEVDATLGQRLDKETEFVLFRVAQEALANVAKHAQARTVRVHLGRKPGWAELDVADDGRGFEQGELGAGTEGHFGLSAMRERVSAMGGTFQVKSRLGGGTVLSARIPIEEAS
jgi:two-component system, NarL family, sensor kinase